MKITITILVVVLIAGGIAFFLKHRSGVKPMDKPKFSDEEYERHYQAKQEALERILGPMHDLVGHAIIPFQVGGAVDMYYFPNGIPGTGFATMELIEPDGSGPKPNRIGTYELVAFTKHRISGKAYDILPHGSDDKTVNNAPNDEGSPFNRMERRMCGILTTVGFYSYDAVLNPGDTCEVPGKEGEPHRCLILDQYRESFQIGDQRHCLLLCLEVFRSEMEYAMQNGSAVVLQKLKEKGYYPYSDLDREPVF
jgi:hypothetical protein